MKRRIALGVVAAALAAGCATGPKFTEVAKSISPIKPGEGRIYFFRSNSMLGAGIQPEIRLNNTVVGASKPGGFFYVDRPAGTFLAATASETEKTLSFVLAAGETKYVRSSVGMGILLYRIHLELEDAKTAQAEVETLSFIGKR
jgi:Protein of unknown function (DUF2846)